MGDSQEHHSPTGWGGVCSSKDQRMPWVGFPHACLHMLTWVHMYEHTHACANKISYSFLSPFCVKCSLVSNVEPIEEIGYI